MTSIERALKFTPFYQKWVCTSNMKTMIIFAAIGAIALTATLLVQFGVAHSLLNSLSSKAAHCYASLSQYNIHSILMIGYALTAASFVSAGGLWLKGRLDIHNVTPIPADDETQSLLEGTQK